MTIEERVEQLEKQVAALMGGGAASDAVPNVIKAKEFVVVNADGKELVRLAAKWDGSGGTLITSSARGYPLVRLTTTDEGYGMLCTYSAERKQLVKLGGTGDGEGMLAIYNANGKELVELGVTEDGTGIVTLFNTSGHAKRGILTTDP